MESRANGIEQPTLKGQEFGVMHQSNVLGNPRMSNILL